MLTRRDFLKTAVIGTTGLAAMSLVGCGSSSSTSSSESSSSESGSSESASQESSSSETVEAMERQTLTVAIHQNAYITDYEDNYLTNYLEEKLNIDIEFYFLPADSSDAATKFNLMATDPDSLPDVVLGNLFTDQEILNYGKNGIFLDLTDYLADAERMPNYNAIPEEDKALMESAQTQSDGRTYSLSNYQPGAWDQIPYRLWINQTWLDDLGLDVPTTTEELKEVLIAFRDEDPNGNGIQDEIGVYGQQSGTYGQNVIKALMNSFIYWPDTNNGFILADDGETVAAAYTQDDFREGLLYMNDLYNEGLLSDEIFSVDGTQFKATLNMEPNVIGLVAAGSYSNWSDANNNENFKDMTMITPMMGPKGIAYSPYSVYSPAQNAYITTFDSEKIDLALTFLDEFYDYTTSIIVRWGEEDVNWTSDEEYLSKAYSSFVEDGIFDKLDIFILDNVWGTNNNKHWYNTGLRYAPESFLTSSTLLEDVEEKRTQPTFGLTSKHYKMYKDLHPDNLLPVLKYTEEENDVITEAVANIPDYVNQQIALFITGQRDINAEWDTFLSELDSMGYQTWREAAQAAYERS